MLPKYSSYYGFTHGLYAQILKGFIDNVISDLLWARAVLLTSPTVATVALTLTIPMAMVSDWIIHAVQYPVCDTHRNAHIATYST